MSFTKPLTTLDFADEDFEVAERVAKKLGYRQTAYTNTSDLAGLYCLAENPEHARGPRHGGVVIKTREFGLMFVQDLSDLGMK